MWKGFAKNTTLIISMQYSIRTDSGNIHKAFDGVLNMTLSIPIRYMHTNHSMIHTDDVEACIRLVCEIAKDMDAEVFESLL